MDAAAPRPVPGGVICCYVATTTQLSRTVEALRGCGSSRAAAWESLVRGWHVDGLAVRPEQRMVGPPGSWSPRAAGGRGDAAGAAAAPGQGRAGR